MKITVLGLSLRGCVIAACCSRYFDVAALDADAALVADLRAGRVPFEEPSLADLLATHRAARRLDISTNTILACVGAEVLWCAEDAAPDEIAPALARLRSVLPNLSPGTLVLLSLPVPAGTCEALWREFPQFQFAVAPLPLPLGSAIDAFEKAAQVVVGVRSSAKEALLETLFAPFTSRVVFLPAETVEASASTDSASESA